MLTRSTTSSRSGTPGLCQLAGDPMRSGIYYERMLRNVSPCFVFLAQQPRFSKKPEVQMLHGPRVPGMTLFRFASGWRLVSIILLSHTQVYP